MQIEKLVVAAVGEGKRPTSYKEIFAAVIPAVEEEQQRQATVSSSAAACSKAAGGGVTLLGGDGCSTGERAQLDKQSTVRVSCNVDTKNALTDANYLSKVTSACHTDYESMICCMYLIAPTNCSICPSGDRVT